MFKQWHEIYVRALASWQPPETDPPSDASPVRHPEPGGPQGPITSIALNEPPSDEAREVADRPRRGLIPLPPS